MTTTAPTVTRERYLSAKELVAAIREQHGLTVSEPFIRTMLRAGVKRVGLNARLSDVMEWWEKNPDFSPRGTRGTVV